MRNYGARASKTCICQAKKNRDVPIFDNQRTTVTLPLRCTTGARRAVAMDDLPAVEPIKIYENTYRMPSEATR